MVLAANAIILTCASSITVVHRSWHNFRFLLSFLTEKLFFCSRVSEFYVTGHLYRSMLLCSAVSMHDCWMHWCIGIARDVNFSSWCVLHEHGHAYLLFMSLSDAELCHVQSLARRILFLRLALWSFRFHPIAHLLYKCVSKVLPFVFKLPQPNVPNFNSFTGTRTAVHR